MLTLPVISPIVAGGIMAISSGHHHLIVAVGNLLSMDIKTKFILPP